MHMVVSDTGPLISLEKIEGGFEFLRVMTNHLLIPEAVLYEAGARLRDPTRNFLDHGIADVTEVIRDIDTSRISVMTGARPLHRGELEALAVALQRNLPILLEDGDARKVAKAAGLRFIGIGGLVLAGVRKRSIHRDEGVRLLNALLVAVRLTRRLHSALIAELHREDQPA